MKNTLTFGLTIVIGIMLLTTSLWAPCFMFSCQTVQHVPVRCLKEMAK